MELIRCYIIPILTIWLLMAFWVDNVETAETCKPTTVQDILDSAYHSEFVYGPARQGAQVPGAAGYTVDKVINRVLMGQPLKAIITKKYSPPTTMICFMGTTTPAQLWHQFTSGISSNSFVRVTIKRKKVKVMRYYFDAFHLLNVQNSMVINPAMKYIVTGHSLGGALASLFSLYMVEKHGGALWKNPESRLITFGAPRVGDGSYAYWHDQFIAPFKKLRIVLDRDIVPQIPYKSLGFRHTSREIWIDETYQYEFYWKKCWRGKCRRLRRKKVWTVCPNGDGDSCSRAVASTSILDHSKEKYTAAVKELKEDTNKLNRFLRDQC